MPNDHFSTLSAAKCLYLLATLATSNSLTPVSLYYMPNIASGRNISGFPMKISRFKNKFHLINFQYSETIIDW